MLNLRHAEIVEMLLARPLIDVNLQDKQVRDMRRMSKYILIRFIASIYDYFTTYARTIG